MKKKKRFVIRKYVMAETAAQALRKEKNAQPDGVWIDEAWMQQNSDFEAKIKGFKK